MARALSSRYPHKQFLVALHEARIDALRLVHHFDPREALHDLFPDNAELKLGKPVADATMDAEAEGKMPPHIRPLDPKVVRPLDHLFVAVARDVPHDHLLALFDG